MKKYRRIPRIIKINKINKYEIHCAFNNGEYRIIDFEKLFKKWGTKKGSSEYPLKDVQNLKKVKLISGTLAWPHIKFETIEIEGVKFDSYLDLDPIVLYENSVADTKMNKRYEIGHFLKSERIKAGLTQSELAYRSGTTKNYISRIENNKSDIELQTLRKIIEIGLDKKLQISVN